MKRLSVLCLLLGACVRVPYQRADAMSAEPVEPLGEDRLSLHWKFETADRKTEVEPQEFASAAIWADSLYTGSANGWFFALRAANGAVRWRKQLGAVNCAPLVLGTNLYVGTSDGSLIAMDAPFAALIRMPPVGPGTSLIVIPFCRGVWKVMAGTPGGVAFAIGGFSLASS
jgi:outer membrane protein assembly factor BamB